jgi:hypothetical protein
MEIDQSPRWRTCFVSPFSASSRSQLGHFRMVDIVVPYELRRNARVEALYEVQQLSIGFFTDRDSYPLEGLRRVKCPILLVHCAEDVAYSLDLAEEVQERMEEAGLSVTLVSVDGAPHYGTFTHYEEYVQLLSVVQFHGLIIRRINPLIHDFILSQCKEDIPMIPQAVVSPFEPDFIAVDCPNLGRELDDEIEFFS